MARAHHPPRDVLTMPAIITHLLLAVLTALGLHPSHLGDYGTGTPDRFDVWTCQTLSGGETIYAPTTNRWTCAPTTTNVHQPDQIDAIAADCANLGGTPVDGYCADIDY